MIENLYGIFQVRNKTMMIFKWKALKNKILLKTFSSFTFTLCKVNSWHSNFCSHPSFSKITQVSTQRTVKNCLRLSSYTFSLFSRYFPCCLESTSKMTRYGIKKINLQSDFSWHKQTYKRYMRKRTNRTTANKV